MIENVSIRPVLNGWIVKVGCQKVVFTTMDTMLENLERYLTDPVATEKQFRESVNAKWVLRDNEVIRVNNDVKFRWTLT